ncbi:MAG: glycerophosphodiester phosphodiesterase [Calditrichaeota bacterium]|nr:MAG: glycerophosphodiester phosphodiesterase [Calditrichota bacterium]
MFDQKPAQIIIAHRGASGYLPEHTLAAKAMAHALGAHYLEQDVVLTADDRCIVLHDIYLDGVTDVKKKFPRRAREDGRYYAIDFTLEEVRTLSVHERTDPRTGRPVYPGRFPINASRFFVPTLEEEIELIQGLNKSTGREAGIYVEIKRPAWHERQGKDPTRAVLAILHRYGYRRRDDRAFIQCFDPATLRRLREEMGCELPLIQLIDEEGGEEAPRVDYAYLRTPEGLAEIAAYAEGIGPYLGQILTGVTADGQPRITTLVADAHAAGLLVHPYTFRADELPPGVPDFDTLLRWFLHHIHVDGLFTDHPDRAVRVLRRLP